MFSSSRSTRHLSFIPIMIVTVLYFIEIFCYEYLFVYISLFYHLERIAWAVACGSVGVLLWALSLWSYLRASFSDPGRVSSDFQVIAAEKGLHVAGYAGCKLGWTPGMVQMCKRCNFKRPERAHHCYMCGMCVLRMDHHCQLIGNCVGFHTTKYFILWLFWTFATFAFFMISSIPIMADAMSSGLSSQGGLDFLTRIGEGTKPISEFDASELFLESQRQLYFIVSISYPPIVFMSLLFLLVNIYNLIRNVSETENCYTGKSNPYNLGIKVNVEQIFGRLSWTWLLPIPIKRVTCDGMSYPTNMERSGFEPLIQPEEEVDQKEKVSEKEEVDQKWKVGEKEKVDQKWKVGEKEENVAKTVEENQNIRRETLSFSGGETGGTVS